MEQVLERLTDDQYQEFVANVFSARQELLVRLGLGDTKRDIDRACGYVEILTLEVLAKLYERDPIAKRIVQIMPKETWKKTPIIFEDADPEVQTEFEKAWSEVADQLRGESWFAGEEGNPIWDVMIRADILSGIGDYGVILLGIDDGLNLDQPAEMTPGEKRRKLNFMQVFDRRYVKVLQVEQDVTNRRYGHPVLYELTFDTPATEGGATIATTTRKVHWSRVIHIADNIETSEWSGVPRLQTAFNRIHDLRKVYGGSGEGYWQAAVPILSVETHPSLGTDVDVDVESTRTQIGNVMDGFQRYLNLVGLTAKTVAPSVTDPASHVAVSLEAICIEIGVPIRIFKGSERGELASSTDASAWNERCAHRQATYVTPRIIVPVVNRLILLGVLPAPKTYRVSWPDLNALSQKEKADVGKTMTEAMSTFVGGNVEALITPVDWLERVMGMSSTEAAAVCEAAAGVFDMGDDDE